MKNTEERAIYYCRQPNKRLENSPWKERKKELLEKILKEEDA